MSIRFRQLKYFMKVVELGSFTHAADSLNVAQPALSQQIAKLEHTLGTQLLIRSSRGATPTENGRIIYRHGCLILQQLDNAISELRATDESPAGHVSVGLPGSVSMIAAVPILTRIREVLPNVIPEIKEGNNDYIEELLLNGRLDVAVLYRSRSIAGVDSDILLREKLFLVCSTNAAFDVPDAGIVTIEDLSRIPLVLPVAGAPKRELIEAQLRSHELPINVVVETAATATTLDAVRAGIGAGILPWSAFASGLKEDDVRVFPLDRPNFTRPMSICTASDQPNSAAARRVEKIVIEVIRSMVKNDEWREVEMLD